MIKLLNSFGIGSLIYGIYLGVSLFIPTNLPKDVVVKENPMVVKENKKIEPPKKSPKMLNQHLISKYEIIDSLDLALTEHIVGVLSKSKYNCMGKNRVQYAQELSSALLQHTNGDLALMLWITSMAKVESSYRLNADPRVSSARGYLQVIYRYHERDLKKLGISKEDISTNTYKSILAGVTVFRKYLKIEHGDFERATKRYRGLSVSEQQQKVYLNAIKAEKARIEKVISQYA